MERAAKEMKQDSVDEALKKQLRVLELNQSLPVLSSSSVVPLQFSNRLSRQLPSTHENVATNNQPLNRAIPYNAAVQYNRGEMYYYGRGVPRNYVKACECYKKAAAQGLPHAQCNLGVLYEQGRGVAQDNVKACKWYEKAAARGFAEAQSNLELVYEGYCERYKKEANQGDAEAQFNLGLMYHYGYGVDKDDVKALEWHRKAADQGHPGAKAALQELAQIEEADSSFRMRP